MKHLKIKAEDSFKVIAGTERSQAAVMTLNAKESTGGPGNKHSESDQWLYVISGDGQAVINGQETTIGPGSLLLIEAGETHEIRNHTEIALRTLNFYCPPEY